VQTVQCGILPFRFNHYILLNKDGSMKITISVKYPDKELVYTADDGAWDTSLSDALELISGVLKAAGYSFSGELTISED